MRSSRIFASRSEWGSGGFSGGFKILGAVMVVALLFSFTDRVPVLAQRPDPASQEQKQIVVATVGNRQISLQQVESQLKRTLGDRELKGEARDVAVAAGTRQLVEQYLVVEYLERTEHGLNSDQVQLQVERLSSALEKTNTGLEEYLKQRKQTLEELRQQIRWQFGWSNYLKKMLGDENLRQYFDDHRIEFDGTRIKVAHLLLAVDSEKQVGSEVEKEQLALANKIRKQLDSGELDWASAVKQFSTSTTSRDREGEMGWIERRQPMPESFSKAAFGLQVKEISQPVRTKFGFHLIKCLKLERGKKELHEVRGEVRDAATRFLFRWVVEQQAPRSQVRYTGKAAYWHPETGRLIRPQS